MDRHIRLGQRRRQLGLQRGQLFALATALQAFDQPVQRPHIVGVLGAALYLPAQAQIVPIDPFRLLDAPPIEQQRSQRMARRVHPRPRLGVGQIVVKLDRLPQMGVGLVISALVIGKLAVEQSRADAERSSGRVAEETPLRRDALQMPVKRSRSRSASAKSLEVA